MKSKSIARRTTPRRHSVPTRFWVESLENRLLLSSQDDLVFHTGHSHTVLQDAALAAAGSSVTLPTSGVAAPAAVNSAATVAAPAASTVTYNRDAALAYAQKYAFDVVSDGYFWINSSTISYYGAGTAVPTGSGVAGGVGDDCAHFVSCCIGTEPHATGGGLPVPSPLSGSYPGYGNPSAPSLISWLQTSGYGTKVSSVSQLTPGDVIGYDWNNDGVIDHCVLYLGNGMIAAHAASHYAVPWNTTYGTGYTTTFIHITVPDSVLPTTPTNITPAANATVTTVTPTLSASAFADTVAGSAQTAAEWLIYKGSTLVYDSGTDTTDLSSIAVPSGKLTNGGTSYTWQVRYEDNYGDWTSYSTPTAFTVGTAAPNQPPTLTSVSASLSSVAEGGSITLTPQGVGDPDGTVANVKYYVESNGKLGFQTGTGGDTLLATATTSPYSVNIDTTSQTPGTTYTIYAQATDNQGATSPVQTTSYTVTPTVTSVVAKAISGYSITITWSPLPAGLNDLDVERSESGGEFNEIALLPVTATSFTDNYLGPDVQYTYRIRATNTSGSENGSYITTAPIYTFILGDANGDGIVDFKDFNILAGNYMSGQPATWASGDFNKDGVVDINDFNILSNNYGQQLPILPLS